MENRILQEKNKAIYVVADNEQTAVITIEKFFIHSFKVEQQINKQLGFDTVIDTPKIQALRDNTLVDVTDKYIHLMNKEEVANDMKIFAGRYDYVEYK